MRLLLCLTESIVQHDTNTPRMQRLTAVTLAVLYCCILGQDPKPKTNSDPDARFPWDDNQYGKTDSANKNRAKSEKSTYFLDNSVDCSNPEFVIRSDQEVNVKGRSTVQTGTPLLKCKMTIVIGTALEKLRFHIGIRSLDIRDCGVTMNIYDGRADQISLASYACKQQSDDVQKRNVLYTSGNTVTFELNRRSRESSNYDIDIDLTPTREGSQNNCNDGIQCSPDGSPLNHQKFEQKYLVLIVGISYLLITAVMVTIITLCCVKNAKSGGHWERRSFGYNNPALNNSGGTTASGKQVSSSNSVWVTPKPYGKEQLPHSQNQMMTKRVPVVTKRFIGANEDADSVFESDAELTSDPRRYRGGNLPRTSTQRNEPRQKRYDHSRDDRFREDDEDDRPKRSHIEREIAIPDKPRRKHPRHEESSNEESFSESERSSDEEDERQSDEGTRHTDVEELETSPLRSRAQHSGLGEDAGEGGPRDDDTLRLGAQQLPPSYQESVEYPPHVQEPHPPDLRYGAPGDPTYRSQNNPMNDSEPRYHAENPPKPRFRAENPAEPIAEYRSSPGQQRRYNHSPASHRREPPAPYRPQPPRNPYAPSGEYPDRYREPDQPSAGNAPSYSYLVRRGYMANTGRSPESSAGGSHHSRDHRLDDSTDYSANLDSGVELMRRTTDV